MATQRAFGRRINPSRPAATEVKAASASRKALAGDAPVDRPAAKADSPPLDEELDAWKKSRKSGFKIPWRQLSLMASLCFGIASFALPSSVNDNVQWLLYALMGASLYAGFSKRRRGAS
jgi:hypothetical protein